MSAQDWRTLDLSPGGRSLIEASAGTGKTWTIAALYLRLLLEQPLTPKQIVVATFTELAAQELRERIRGRIVQAELLARAALEHAGEDAAAATATDDAWRDWLQAQWRVADGGFDAARARQAWLRLRLALAELDIAPIGTLHGLCQRILREAPFDAGSGFVADDMIDGGDLLAELADDAWRGLVQGAAADADAQAWIAGGRKKLHAALKDALQPGVGVVVPAPLSLEEFAHLPSALRAVLADVARFNTRAKVLRRGLSLLADYIDAGDAQAAYPDTMLADLSVEPEKHIKPEHLVDPDIAGMLHEVGEFVSLAQAQLLIPLARGLATFAEHAHRDRDQRLRARGQLDFDGLIERVHAALHAHPHLADALHARWPVALVDEFQDTDALQYGVLDRIHRDDAGAPRGRLAMIGDPKQAIYRFRGGDIHAYLDAAARVPATDRIALDMNRRSSRAYVDACNEWHARGGDTLSSDAAHAIRYQRVEASGRRDDTPYRIDGEVVAKPLALHYLHDDPGDAPARKRRALEACAAQIVELLAGGHRIGEKPVQPGDIAVLLPNNADIEQLRALLQARRVPCVGAGRSSVFASPWAHELRLQLQVAVDPGDAGLLRAALAGRLGGFDYATLRALARGEAGEDWQRQLDRYQALHATWQRRGVLAVVQALLADASPRLFAGRDGERALTDLRQLGELLQAQESERAGPAQLLAWLARQMGAGADAGEEAGKERQLRIESDAQRVQLMTVHAAKGLEFPIVLLPLMWANDGRRDRKAAFVVLHDDSGGRALRFDEQACRQSEQDAQDERHRLLYVALTRAEHACHVYALPPDRRKDGSSKSPFIDPERAPLDAVVERMLERGAPFAHIDWRQGWPSFDGAYHAEALPTATRKALPEPPAPAVHERKHSFTTLMREDAHRVREESAASDETVDDDGIETLKVPASAPHPALLALARWKGTEFGNALHLALEQRRFDRPLRTQGETVLHALRECGVRLPAGEAEQRALADAVAARLDDTLAAELAPGLRLADIAPARWRAEMAFDYALRDVQVAALRAACIAHGEAELVPALGARTLGGLMTGKIDLVFEHDGRFHVLDWKGNWLGERLEDYAPATLPAAMDAHHYRLQALLYTVAVDRYLRQRVRGYDRARHLGDAYYLFVRAVGLSPQAGVWRHRFDDALIDAVDRALAGTEGAA